MRRCQVLMDLKDKRVVVIGTGIGGSGIAALLAKEGAGVLVLERNDYPGGKAATFERDGFRYDTGVHWVARGEKGPLGEISREVGGNLSFKVLEPAMHVSVGGKSTNLTQDMDNEEELERIFEELGVLPENREGARAFFKDVMKPRSASEIAELDEYPLSEYLTKFTLDPQFFMLVSGFIGMYLVIAPKQASTAEFLLCFEGQAREQNLSYPIGGMGAMPQDYLDALERMGGEIRYSTPVARIVVENGKVTGVETDSGEIIPADIIISNNGVKESVEMAGRHNFPEDYLEMADKLRLSLAAVSVKYALDAEVVHPHLIYYFPKMEELDKQVGIFCPVPSAADPTLAPPGCQIVLAGAPASPKLDDPAEADAASQAVLDKIEYTMQHLFPDIEKHVVWKLRTNTQYSANISGRKTGEVIGAAQNRFQVGKNRPKNQTPVENLYLVGADVGGRGVGTEMAADSALNLWRYLAK
jgi:phytoene dehydrogenase-like protein